MLCLSQPTSTERHRREDAVGPSRISRFRLYEGQHSLIEDLTVDDKLFILFSLRMLQFLQWNRLNCHVFSFLQISEFDSAVLSCLLHEHVFARRNSAFISGVELAEHQGGNTER